MLPVLLEAFAIASGGILSIGSILIVLLLLGSADGLRKASAYSLGYLGGYTTIGLLVLTVGGRLARGRPDAGPSTAGSVFFLVLGVLLFTGGVRRWRRPKEEAEGPPRFLRAVDSFSARKALGVGLLVSAINPKNLAIFLAAVGVLVTPRLTPAQALLGLLGVVALFGVAVGVPIASYLLARERADQRLVAMRAWLERNSRPLGITVMMLFGSLFALRGAWHLLR